MIEKVLDVKGARQPEHVQQEYQIDLLILKVLYSQDTIYIAIEHLVSEVLDIRSTGYLSYRKEDTGGNEKWMGVTCGYPRYSIAKGT
jgi:hypothetical protein